MMNPEEVVDIYVTFLRLTTTPNVEDCVHGLRSSLDNVCGFPLFYMKQALIHTLQSLKNKQQFLPTLEQAIVHTVVNRFVCEVDANCVWHYVEEPKGVFVARCSHTHGEVKHPVLARDMFSGVYSAMSLNPHISDKFTMCWLTLFVAMCLQTCGDPERHTELVWSFIRYQSEAFLWAYGAHPPDGQDLEDVSALSFTFDRESVSRSDILGVHELCMRAVAQTCVSAPYERFVRVIFSDLLAPVVAQYVATAATIMGMCVEEHVRLCNQCGNVASFYGDQLGEFYCYMHTTELQNAPFSVCYDAMKFKNKHQLWGVYTLWLLRQSRQHINFTETALVAACQLVVNYMMLHMEKFTTPDMNQVLTTLYIMQQQQQHQQHQPHPQPAEAQMPEQQLPYGNIAVTEQQQDADGYNSLDDLDIDYSMFDLDFDDSLF